MLAASASHRFAIYFHRYGLAVAAQGYLLEAQAL
jgi:hypothetical protein